MMYNSELYQDENKIEYFNNLYLSKHILNNRENALNYFYTSPFYTSRTHLSLNENIRIGKLIKDEEGYLFEISYDNLNVLKQNEPSENIAYHLYYNTNSIFHISMIHKYKLKNNIYDKVVKLFCIFNGKIYCPISFGELLNKKINNIVLNIENFFDEINSMLSFNISSNYYFENTENINLEQMYKEYKLKDIYTDNEKEDSKNENNIQYMKNIYEPSIRLAEEELFHMLQNKN